MKADKSIIPFARSYDGYEWESAPGPRAIRTEDISCSDDSCLIELPALQNVGESYMMLKKNVSIDDRGQIARFLEQVSQLDIVPFLIKPLILNLTIPNLLPNENIDHIWT